MLTYTSILISAHLAANFNAQEPPTEKLQREDFWKRETLGISKPVSEKVDEKALQKLNDTIRFDDGRSQLTWHWKEESPSLPTKYELTMGRLRSFVNKFTKNP